MHSVSLSEILNTTKSDYDLKQDGWRVAIAFQSGSSPPSECNSDNSNIYDPGAYISISNLNSGDAYSVRACTFNVLTNTYSLGIAKSFVL